MKRVIFGAALVVAATAGTVLAQERADTRGLDGREVTAIAFSQMDPDTLFVGTEDGLFAKDVTGTARFRRVRGVPFESCRVNAIRSYAYSREVLVATETGLFSVDAFSLTARRVFSRSDTEERACVSVVLLEDGSVIVATRAGLFGLRPKETAGTRLSAPFDTSVPAPLFGAKKVVYAAAQEGVFRSEDAGLSWKKVFDAGALAPESDASAPDEEETADIGKKIVDITGLEDDPDTVCLATTFGVFQTRDGAKTWQTLSLSGLDYASVRAVFIHPVLREVLCLTRTGLYLNKDDGWTQLTSVYEGRSMTGFGTDLLYADKTGIYACDPLMQSKIAGVHPPGPTAFIHEPTIEEVQRMATEYAEVSNDKIKDWRRRASVKAFLPEFSLGYDKSVYGSSSGAFAVGPRDWTATLKWGLGDLIFNDDQTSIDTRSKLMVQLRNDILAEVTRLYFERRRLQIELAGSPELAEDKRVDKELRLQELTALINRLTGGHFEKVLKSFN